MSEWIKIEEQMPEENIRVLIAEMRRSGWEISTGIYRLEFKDTICWYLSNSCSVADPEYWMPLPKPPETL